MKKFCVYFVLIFIVFFIVEFLSYIAFKKFIINDENPLLKIVADYRYFLPKKYDLHTIKRKFRKQKGNPQKGEIIFIGSHILYPYEIKLQDTLPYLVYKATSRSVYRLSHENFGLNNIYTLFADNFIKDNIKNPEYIIYLHRYSDIDNVFNTQFEPRNTIMNKKYKIIDDEYLVEIKNHFLILNSLYFVKCLEYLTAKLTNKDNSGDILLIYLEQIKEKTEKNYPNKTPKLIFVNIFYDLDFEIENTIKELGWTCLNLYNTVSVDEYCIKENDNKQIAEILIKKLNL